MEIATRTEGAVTLLTIKGRLDAAGAADFQKRQDEVVPRAARGLVLDFSGVNYLSSAGVRVLLTLRKQLQARHGVLAIAALQPYCREVLEMTGMAAQLLVCDTPEAAWAAAEKTAREAALAEGWDQLEIAAGHTGVFRFLPGGHQRGAIEVLGDVKDVLFARVKRADLSSKRFFETEYSIGLGGLGDQPDDYYQLMGEMITIGGTMVWLPTDGQDTPDFLIPKTDTGRHVMIRTGFNAVVAGGFNEYAVFQAAEPGGATMSALYADLFQLARRRRPDFKGALGVAMRAHMPAVFGSGVKKAPVEDLAPENGKMITHESNRAAWMDCDTAPRHGDVTGLICGVGVDLSSDLSDYDETVFNRVFYIHPANVGGARQLLHNHVVIFNALPMPARPVDFEGEIRRVVEHGQFRDMRHLLDSSTVSQAFVGINYIQEFRDDPHGVPADSAAAPGLNAETLANLKYYQQPEKDT